MEISLNSVAFEEGGMIPEKYTCDGLNISPQLSWSLVPEETKSFVLICDDPDAQMGTWVHWVLFNIPADVRSLHEEIPHDKVTDNGAIHGINDFRKFGYGGPCPPSGMHRYYFKIFAINRMLDPEPGKTKAAIMKEIEGNIIAKGQLMGKYKRR